MQWWYSVVSALPFDWSRQQFMADGLLAILLAAPLFAFIGTMVVQNRMAFFSDALGHGAFTGIAIGAIIGLAQTTLGASTLTALCFALLFAVVVTLVRLHTGLSSDTVIGIFSSVGIALGLFIVTKSGLSYNRLGYYLVGDILSVQPTELVLMAILLLVILLVWLMISNRLLLTGVDPALAKSRGIHTTAIELAFACLLSTVVTLSIPWFGLLVINSYLVLPAGAARNIARNYRQYTLLTLLISLGSGVGGLILAYYLGAAAGATIVLVCAVVFFATFVFRTNRRR